MDTYHYIFLVAHQVKNLPAICKTSVRSLGQENPLEKGKVTHSSVLAWRIPWTTEELYKKDLHNPDNHNGVITHLEPNILGCEVKWALGSITTNKATGGYGIPVE